MRIQVGEKEIVVPLGSRDQGRCKSCGVLLVFAPTIRGRKMPLELDSVREVYQPGDWTIGHDGRSRPGMPMFDAFFIVPHWAGCPGADAWREWWEKGK